MKSYSYNAQGQLARTVENIIPDMGNTIPIGVNDPNATYWTTIDKAVAITRDYSYSHHGWLIEVTGSSKTYSRERYYYHMEPGRPNEFGATTISNGGHSGSLYEKYEYNFFGQKTLAIKNGSETRTTYNSNGSINRETIVDSDGSLSETTYGHVGVSKDNEIGYDKAGNLLGYQFRYHDGNNEQKYQYKNVVSA
ncbi:hypothetical protein [Catenovulum sediminis]|uniref:hypothetical protein n=1 Tax=Catenovulum sediminis TaxID=1740262 RepID=UPI00117D4FEE|nr:hypothetical protein [Catenovulum sediminis]